VAIGDAPSTGIKSAFVARFIANVFSALVAASADAKPADILHEVSRRLSGHTYFEWISMQCVDIDVGAGRLAVANAGHPFPVLYVARRQKWDCLPVRGELLHGGELDSIEAHHYEQRHVEIEAGDVLVLLRARAKTNSQMG
jgi:serine phosphatase RsbU (regulator of sigma subunit)